MRLFIEKKYDEITGEEIVDRSTYPVGTGMPEEPVYVELEGVMVLMHETTCVLCGAPFRSPQQDMSYSPYGMSFKYNNKLPREVAKLCSNCWKDVYIKSRAIENTEAINKAVEFMHLMGEELGRSGEQHEEMLKKVKEEQEDQVQAKWKQFCKDQEEKKRQENEKGKDG